MFTLVLTALITAAGLMAIFAEPIVRLTAPGFDEEQVELAARLARILLAASALVAATNLLSGLLQAHRRFLWPAVVGIPFNVAMIGAALLLAGDLGAVALALGFVLGSAARVAVLAPGLREIRFRPALRFDLRDPGLRRVLTLAPLVLVGHSVANVNLVVAVQRLGFVRSHATGAVQRRRGHRVRPEGDPLARFAALGFSHRGVELAAPLLDEDRQPRPGRRRREPAERTRGRGRPGPPARASRRVR